MVGAEPRGEGGAVDTTDVQFPARLGWCSPHGKLKAQFDDTALRFPIRTHILSATDNSLLPALYRAPRARQLDNPIQRRGVTYQIQPRMPRTTGPVAADQGVRGADVE